MNGFVDEGLRALLRVPVSAARGGERMDLLAWIDTAFNGGLAIPRQQVVALGLVKESSAEAVLADGRTVDLETFACSRLIGSGTPTRRRSPPATGSIRCSVPYCWTGTAWTSTTRPEQSN